MTTLLDGHHFDRFVEGLCDRFYAPVMGRPSLAPGRYFRLLLVGYFEGIDSERGIAWRATDSLAVRSFLRLAVDEAPPDHSTIARTRRLIDLETHRTVFTWVQQRLVEAGRLKGKTIAIDATTLEANAAMRSIVRRDTGESYQAFLAGLAKASGIETPTREGLARLDRKRKKKTSNKDWTNPHDPDAKVTKMKDGRTHLAHKAEHAVDMETGAIVAVTLQGADVGDTTTIIETAIAAAEQVEDAQANVDDRQSLEEIVGDKGYHSNQTLIDLDAVGIRSYVSEPDRGRRDWSKDPEARAPVYGNRRRMRGRRGRRLMRQRGERIERSFAHLYDTGGMRRTHLRGHTNILKRLLIHAGGFNLGLVMRHLIGIGTPRGLQGRVAAVLATLGVLMGVVRRRLTTISSSHRLIPAVRGRLASLATFAVNSSAAITCTTAASAGPRRTLSPPFRSTGRAPASVTRARRKCAQGFPCGLLGVAQDFAEAADWFRLRLPVEISRPVCHSVDVTPCITISYNFRCDRLPSSYPSFAIRCPWALKAVCERLEIVDRRDDPALISAGAPSSPHRCHRTTIARWPATRTRGGRTEAQ